jgi:ubiquinone/menaquinone biosynthesis C-methylase UbiE
MKGISMNAVLPKFEAAQVAASLSKHLAMYRTKTPSYQTVMMNDLAQIWAGPHDRLLDIGGGTGVMAQLISELMPVGTVEAVDVVNRYCETLTIKTHVYDGIQLPFADASFDAATINNVMHHVPIPVRAPLMKEIRRVVAGPVYIKDHIAASIIDHTRLSILDFIGNIPFGGMVKADYLTAGDWQELRSGAGYNLAAATSGAYRGVAYSAIFPNRLETTMRWEAA